MESNRSTTQPDALQQGAQRLSLLDNLNISGFSVICAWHFLVIFSAMPAMGEEAINGRLAIYQLVLYLSLAASYIVLMLVTNTLVRAMSKRSADAWKRLNVVFGIFASLATLLVVLAKGRGFYLELSSWVIIGASEAFLMYPWLQLPSVSQDKMGSPINFAFNMGIGGVVAFIIGNLVSPYNYIALCLLPAVASLSLSPVWNAAAAIKDDEHLVVSFPIKVLENSHFIFYGICFGICQFVFSAEGHNGDFINYIVADSWPICSVILSALIIILACSRGLASGRVITIQHLSSLVFIAGIVASFYFAISINLIEDETYRIGMLGSEMLCFAGFNTFDFGFMIFAFFKASKFKSGFANFICFNRATLYLSMGIGLAIGGCSHWLLSAAIPNHATLIVGTVIVLLCISMLPVFDRYIPIDSAPSTAPKPIAEREPEPREAISEEPTNSSEGLDEAVEEISEAHSLSKREREIFSLLAREMSANDIQREIGISIHTVKTHMSSVYRKLDIHSARELVAMVNEKAAERESSGNAPEVKKG